MAQIAYEIVPDADHWIVTRNGERGAAYLTVEAAFQAAAAQALIEMRSEPDIVISILPINDVES